MRRRRFAPAVDGLERRLALSTAQPPLVGPPDPTIPIDVTAPGYTPENDPRWDPTQPSYSPPGDFPPTDPGNLLA